MKVPVKATKACIRIPSVFNTLEELNQLWSYAEDLETYEYTCKEYLSLFAGPVSRNVSICLHELTQENQFKARTSGFTRRGSFTHSEYWTDTDPSTYI